jgi:hypothetical protein
MSILGKSRAMGGSPESRWIAARAERQLTHHRQADLRSFGKNPLEPRPVGRESKCRCGFRTASCSAWQERYTQRPPLGRCDAHPSPAVLCLAAQRTPREPRGPTIHGSSAISATSELGQLLIVLREKGGRRSEASSKCLCPMRLCRGDLRTPPPDLRPQTRRRGFAGMAFEVPCPPAHGWSGSESTCARRSPP